MSAIEIRNVKKRYKDLQALKGVSLSVEEGEFFGLLGPNGAGKTTLISILAGLARADEGNIAVRGHDVVGDFRAAQICVCSARTPACKPSNTARTESRASLLTRARTHPSFQQRHAF